jgi:CheY-like chemotaxis protein
MARILIIDDEESILESLQILLQQAGHTVETATNGKVINRHMNGTSPDLILLDYYLPDRNGDSIACELKSREDTKLSQGNEQMFQSMRAQFDQSQRLMSDITSRVSDQLLEVTKGVTETKESTKQVFTIAEQLSSLKTFVGNRFSYDGLWITG